MRMLTVREASQRLGLREATIRSWIAQRRLAHLKLGRAVRLPEAEIERIIERSLIPARSDRNAR